MKRALRVIVPILLILAVLASIAWYFLVYDQALTKELLLKGARYFERNGNREISTFLYDVAYSQSDQDDDVAIELAQQYLDIGNFTKAEYTLSEAIAANPSVNLYMKLSEVYVQQDKLLDAVSLLDYVTDPDIKQELENLRPKAPVMSPDPGFYSQYITVEATADQGTLYINTKGEYPSVEKDRYMGPITLDVGETVLYALIVNDNGLVSPLAVYGYTIGGIVEQVEFHDKTVEALIRTAIEAGPRDVLFTNQLWSIKEITLPADVKSFEDLAYLPHLTHLTIEKGATGDLAVLEQLDKLEHLSLNDRRITEAEMEMIGTHTVLKHLSLNNCSLSSISPLKDLVNLEYLDLSNNTLRNINILSGMKNLKELYLGSNAVTSLDVLSGLTSIEKLDVSYNTITTLEPLRGMYDSILELNASHNQISSIQGLPDLQKLTVLDLSNNNITDVTSLMLLTELNQLNLSNNALTSINGIESMLQLHVLKIAYNQIEALPPFQLTCQLVSIDASHNLLTDLEPLAGLPWLNNVNVDYNPELESLEPLDKCPVLVRVNAYGTLVTDVSFLTAKSIIVNFDPTLVVDDRE